MRCRVHSPDCCSWWGAGSVLSFSCSQGQFSCLLQVARGWEEDIFPSPIPPQCRWGGVGHFCSHALRASSPVPTPRGNRMSSMVFHGWGTGPALPAAAADERQGQLSPTLMTSGPAFPSLQVGKDRAWKRLSFPHPLYHKADERGKISHSQSWGLVNMVSFIVLSRWGVGPLGFGKGLLYYFSMINMDDYLYSFGTGSLRPKGYNLVLIFIL